MPQPATQATRYPQAWHAAQEADERAWLDQWARLELIPVTEPPAAPMRPLVTTGRH